METVDASRPTTEEDDRREKPKQKTRKTVGASRPTREEGNRMENPK